MKTIVNILGIPFHKFDLHKSLQLIDQACEQKKSFFCVTPNPEICLLALNDPDYHKILKSAELSIPDGFGILWASRYLRGNRNLLRWIWTLVTPGITLKYSDFPERVTGTDLMKNFCEKYKKRRIFLLGASPAVNNKLAGHLLAKGINIVGNYSGDASIQMELQLLKHINSAKAEVLFVAFGAPKQEKWIYRNLSKLETVKVAIGIGGAFDFLAGYKKRAPAWMRNCGLEWLFRLLVEPKRIGRIFNATVVFPWKVFLDSRIEDRD